MDTFDTDNPDHLDPRDAAHELGRTQPIDTTQED